MYARCTRDAVGGLGIVPMPRWVLVRRMRRVRRLAKRRDCSRQLVDPGRIQRHERHVRRMSRAQRGLSNLRTGLRRQAVRRRRVRLVLRRWLRHGQLLHQREPVRRGHVLPMPGRLQRRLWRPSGLQLLHGNRLRMPGRLPRPLLNLRGILTGVPTETSSPDSTAAAKPPHPA